MAENNIPKWQTEVEAMLRERYQGNEFSDEFKKATELVNLVYDLEIPSGVMGQILAAILKLASTELPPLTAVHTGFQFGMAYERYQNANRA